jgi:transcriptional regulator with XRE-family HTH domain
VINLRALRLNRGKSLDDVAAETGVSKGVLARAERGESIPRPRAQFQIARFYGYQPTDIWPIDAEPVEEVAA